MSATKTEFKWFDITMHEEEQAYLREMHQQGWRLQKVRWVFYTFERCEPCDVIYQLDYNSTIEDRGAYLQMFTDCGWEYIQDMMGYSYFRKPVSEMQGGAEEIFCDHESRMAMWDRVFKGRVQLLLIMLCCVIVPQLFVQAQFDTAINGFLCGMFFGLLVVYIWMLVRFAVRYHKAKNGEGR